MACQSATRARWQARYLRLLLCDLDTPRAIHGSFLGRLGIIPRARLHFADRRQLRSRLI
jgi:hypothetical protein